MHVEFVSSRSLREKRWETDGVLVVMPFTKPAEARRTAQLMARRSGTDGLLLGVYDEGLHAPPAALASSPPAAAPAAPAAPSTSSPLPIAADGNVAADVAAAAGRAGFVALVNAVFQSSVSPWFCYVAQDAFPGRQWLSIALAGLEHKKGVLASFNDGKWHGRLASFGLARREWAEKLYGGDFFFPGYGRHYADVELTVLALQQQGLVYTPESVLVEIDWEKDGKPVSREDRALYLSRVQQRFDGRVDQPALLERFR
ncbi:hypothetical protein [Lacisediminimonas sp.]|uniref:hypothetical protein n=1 Tax=Lacisediminimonas sp. TaxID=3060582 RepID=UPI00271D6F24|nr:hypothetical protein [Lacisediminimonas sp.]MDO8299766.1 hypothetical protein [Lacisediminimonas sp.]